MDLFQNNKDMFQTFSCIGRCLICSRTFFSILLTSDNHWLPLEPFLGLIVIHVPCVSMGHFSLHLLWFDLAMLHGHVQEQWKHMFWLRQLLFPLFKNMLQYDWQPLTLCGFIFADRTTGLCCLVLWIIYDMIKTHRRHLKWTRNERLFTDILLETMEVTITQQLLNRYCKSPSLIGMSHRRWFFLMWCLTARSLG
jgi:hypothetical protein